MQDNQSHQDTDKSLYIDEVNLKVENGVLKKFQINNVEKAKIPNGVREIASFAIYNFSAKYLEIPNSVQVLRTHAFLSGKHLLALNIKNPEISLERRCLNDLPDLKAIFIGGQKVDAIVTQEEDKTYGTCLEKYVGESESYTIDSDVNYIEESAFSKCVTLKNLEIPQSVSSIEFYAFRGCKNLEKVKLPDKLHSMSLGCFEGCTSIKEITIPKSIIFLGAELFKGWKKDQTINVPSKFKKLRIFQQWRRGCKAKIVYY